MGVLTGCSSMKPEDFAGTEPRFRLEEFFEGQTRAWGIFEDRFSNLRRQFTVDIDGEWDGQTLTLVEDFVYADGETEQRIWTIRPDGENGYVGEAGNVVGTASGAAYGNALNWQYYFDLDIGDRTINVHFDDWMFLQPDGESMINRAHVTKWGIEIGSAFIFFRKADDELALEMDQETVEQAIDQGLAPGSAAAQ
ncbi:DUF3833 domain-containing protein [Fodinicurvata sp. EGI_FJ10296]|uniref:DUF3833 domain-containing protein n=1 Tax=Fodinicurvata sp. EGI_FJ10296 TaxID=3231908 RepID=UPI003451D6A5